MMVAADLMRRGHKIALPYGEDWDYDLIVCRDAKLERVQVKHARSNGAVIPVPTRSMSLTNGKVKAYKLYTAEMIDWLAVYDPVTDRCYYIPASVLGSGMTMLHLRLSDTRNNQRIGVRFASDYVDF
jgi:PD-(D/E)XK nuclease superfamily protein